MKKVSFMLPVLGAALISSAIYAGGPVKQAQGKAMPTKHMSPVPAQNQTKTDSKQTISKPVTAPNKEASAKQAATNTQTGSKSAQAAKRHHHSNHPMKKSGAQ